MWILFALLEKKYFYNKSYSSDKKKGGGVLLDLSHEIDYVFGYMEKLNFVILIIKKYQI